LPTICLVDLHFESRTSVPGINADHLEPASAQLVDKPRRHGTGLDRDRRTITRMAPNRLLDLLRSRRALASP
jgi:hypothetical protein